MKDTFKKIKTYIIAHKVPTIVVSAVLAVSIVAGVTVGVINHNKTVEYANAFGTESSLDSNSKSTISVPPIEVDSSEGTVVSSEDDSSSAAQTIETTSTPSKEDTVSSKTTSSKSSSSTSSKTTSTSSKTNTATSSKISGSNSSASTSSKWVCPDPSAHSSNRPCVSQKDHDLLVLSRKESKEWFQKEEERIASEKANGTWIDTGKYCITCHRPLGDGHNGTCDSHLENGKWTCQYDY